MMRRCRKRCQRWLMPPRRGGSQCPGPVSGSVSPAVSVPLGRTAKARALSQRSRERCSTFLLRRLPERVLREWNAAVLLKHLERELVAAVSDLLAPHQRLRSVGSHALARHVAGGKSGLSFRLGSDRRLSLGSLAQKSHSVRGVPLHALALQAGAYTRPLFGST